MRRFTLVSGFAVLFGTVSFNSSFAQTLPASGTSVTATPAAAGSRPAPEALAQAAVAVRSSSELPRFGVGVRVGSLGIGFEAATALAPRINLRGGFNVFSYSHAFSKDGADYNATLNLRSVDAKVDLYVLGGFYVSPGVLLYDDNHVSATAAVGSGRNFTLGGVTYISNPASPITGAAALTFNKISPTLGVGFGNLLPRWDRHFSITVDLGVILQGSPQFDLALGGSACVNNLNTCSSVNLVPGLPANITAQENKISNDLRQFKYYPEASVGFGWKF